MIDLSKLVDGAKVTIPAPDSEWQGYVFPIGTFTVTAVQRSPLGVPTTFNIAEEPRMIPAKLVAAIE